MPQYTWKHGISGPSNRGLKFDRPLLEGMAFADLLTGKTYRVHSLIQGQRTRPNYDIDARGRGANV
jgi:hypothetical protein